MKKTWKKWFTLVELVVVMIILATLSVIWIVSYTSNLGTSRNATRKLDLTSLSSALSKFQQEKWNFPMPGSWSVFNITYWPSDIVAYQWKMNNKVPLSTIDKIPYDPKIDIPYTYSITKNKQEFQLAASFEWLDEWDKTKAVVLWNYSSVSRNILPTILVANTWAIDIKSDNTKFIFDWQSHNIPYTLYAPYEPKSDWYAFNNMLIEIWDKYFQNSSYRSCEEIKEAGKAIPSSSSIEYQILNSNWELTDKNCTIN